MSNSRDAILARLRANPTPATFDPAVAAQPTPSWTLEEKIERLTSQLEAVRGEVIDWRGRDWIDWVNQELPRRGLSRVVVGDHTRGQDLQARADQSLTISRYQHAIEEWKDTLFNDIEVGITATRGGIAQTGSLILWPDASEPRLMSLVPPVHIALLDVSSIHSTFAEAVAQGQWAKQMPTNALLISGPSKTADIEQTLSYGIHGPQQLIVLLLDP